MNKKYSGFSRSSLRKLEEGDADRPPQFVKLHVGSSSGYGDSNFRTNKPIAVDGKTGTGSAGSQQYPDQKSDGVDVNQKSKLPSKTDEEKPSSSETRPKEVVESVPIQNQATAQKLLQKLSQPNQKHCPGKDRKYRGKEKQEDPTSLTLEEYENRKLQAKYPMTEQLPDTSHDENIAWQLQNQLNVEHSQVQRGYDQEAKAEDIRVSMFNYERVDSSHHMGYEGGRGRGMGRGKGRGRGRGRGRGW